MPTSKFLMIIGAPKCGTTSLAHWLDQDDRFFLMPGKEPGYFRTRTERFVIDGHRPTTYSSPSPDSAMVNYDAYMDLSKMARENQWAIDASTDYLSDEGSPERIKDFGNRFDVKLLCILRDPIDRAFSEYRHTIRDGLEPLSFRDSLIQEAARRNAHFQPLFFHARRSQYFDDLKKYRRYFGDNLLLLDVGDISNASICSEKLYNFLGIEPAYPSDMLRLNSSDDPRTSNQTRNMRHLLSRAAKSLIGRSEALAPKRVSFSAEDYTCIFDLLKDDIKRCVEDPSIPTDGWPSAKLLQGLAAKSRVTPSG